jgi:pyruvate carboxylase subunit B
MYANYDGKVIDAVEQGKTVRKGDVLGYLEK